jgi:hypothetical protein
MRRLLVIAAIVVGGLLVIHLGGVSAKDPPPHGHSGSTAVSLKTIQTYRTITVSPAAVNCGGYHRGEPPNQSVDGAMGFPWGTCAVGDRVNGKDPITISYNGMQGYVYVHAGWAMPNGNEVGTPWRPCSSAGHKAVACTGEGGLPGYNQYIVRNFSPQSAAPTQINGNNVCDVNFQPTGGCYAIRGDAQREGLYLTGPSKIPGTDTAQSWTAWVIWTAEPPGVGQHHK